MIGTANTDLYGDQQIKNRKCKFMNYGWMTLEK